MELDAAKTTFVSEATLFGLSGEAFAYLEEGEDVKRIANILRSECGIVQALRDGDDQSKRSRLEKE